MVSINVNGNKRQTVNDKRYPLIRHHLPRDDRVALQFFVEANGKRYLVGDFTAVSLSYRLRAYSDKAKSRKIKEKTTNMKQNVRFR